MLSNLIYCYATTAVSYRWSWFANLADCLFWKLGISDLSLAVSLARAVGAGQDDGIERRSR